MALPCAAAQPAAGVTPRLPKWFAQLFCAHHLPAVPSGAAQVPTRGARCAHIAGCVPRSRMACKHSPRGLESSPEFGLVCPTSPPAVHAGAHDGGQHEVADGVEADDLQGPALGGHMGEAAVGWGWVARQGGGPRDAAHSTGCGGRRAEEVEAGGWRRCRGAWCACATPPGLSCAGWIRGPAATCSPPCPPATPVRR